MLQITVYKSGITHPKKKYKTDTNAHSRVEYCEQKYKYNILHINNTFSEYCNKLLVQSNKMMSYTVFILYFLLYYHVYEYVEAIVRNICILFATIYFILRSTLH